MKLTILHLSDLHLGNDFIPRAIWARRGWWRPVSPELTAGLVEVIRKRREGYVVISGDFVNKAKESTFKHASAYLKSLFQASGFDIQDRLFLSLAIMMWVFSRENNQTTFGDCVTLENFCGAYLMNGTSRRGHRGS